ncbi:MAG: cell division/cell wall cluster transcriptional repressor MraZ, partial [Lachnospiraceae bacterium]
LPLTNKEARKFTRFFLGSAVEGGLDKQGRVLISSALREFASLEKDVVLVGVLDRVEIWDKAKWDENNAAIEDNMDDIAEHMSELGLSI